MLAGAAFAALGMAFVATGSEAQTPKPNILFILVDNLGYGELGIYGGGQQGAAPPRSMITANG
jgi:arylsulfatase A-like enzyme